MHCACVQAVAVVVGMAPRQPHPAQQLGAVVVLAQEVQAAPCRPGRAMPATAWPLDKDHVVAQAGQPVERGGVGRAVRPKAAANYVIRVRTTSGAEDVAPPTTAALAMGIRAPRAALLAPAAARRLRAAVARAQRQVELFQCRAVRDAPSRRPAGSATGIDAAGVAQQLDVPIGETPVGWGWMLR